ncbi:cytochrome C' [Parasulfuritortus cantonensis]|uniref:Cytochrome C n=1 Tax=Parasulfuritortus cantonensis TaxID=2528202 RepID=A0A4R1BHD8_9PROT|nr:cytochrome C' [Parasulfuritortus cantonensis]TCJ16594.1 cytochrome C' [Parasulfuritortus cantonensis]
MKILTAVFAAAALTIAAPSMADDALKACAACHDATAKKIGPSWKDVNAKVGAKLGDVVKEVLAKGSKGVYGKIPMPPQPKSVADADAITKAIASHK